MTSKRPQKKTKAQADDNARDSESEDEQLIFGGENAIEGYTQPVKTEGTVQRG